MRIAFGTDERTELTDHIKAALAERGHEVVVLGEGDPGRTLGGTSARPWPAAGPTGGGVLLDGTGVSMAANKVPGVRAALCTDGATAEGARRWNDANVLALGLRLTSATLADEMVDAFLATGVDADEEPNIRKLG